MAGNEPLHLTQVRFSEYPDFLLSIDWDCNPQQGYRYTGWMEWRDPNSICSWSVLLRSWSIYGLLQGARQVIKESEERC